MSIEAMKQALEALENPWSAGPEGVADAITAIRTAIEQAEKQEPVAWQGVYDKTDLYYRKPPQADVRPLYTTPPKAQRQWVGLTDEEIFKVENAVPDEVIGDSNWCVYFAKAIEAKLKEKNT
jgi:hypothetical protein